MAATETTIKQDQLKWSTAPDYRAVLQLNRQYFRGEMMTTPYSHHPFDDDTKPDASLLRLHDYGLLPYGWQSGGSEGPLLAPGAMASDLSDTNKSHYYELQKRDYLRFLAPEGIFGPATRLPHNPQSAFVSLLVDDPALITRVVRKNHVTLPNLAAGEYMGSGPVSIVRRRTATTWLGLDDAGYREDPCEPAVPVALDHPWWRCDAVARARPLEFRIATMDWDGRVRVGAAVEKAARQVGLQRIYGEGS